MKHFIFINNCIKSWKQLEKLEYINREGWLV